MIAQSIPISYVSFNPRPSRKRGATRSSCAGVGRDDVSILAPLARGALQQLILDLDAGLEVSILAPLARGALPDWTLTRGTTTTFQSSPLSQEGRYKR